VGSWVDNYGDLDGKESRMEIPGMCSRKTRGLLDSSQPRGPNLSNAFPHRRKSGRIQGMNRQVCATICANECGKNCNKLAQICMSAKHENAVEYGDSVVCYYRAVTQSENRGSTPLGGTGIKPCIARLYASKGSIAPPEQTKMSSLHDLQPALQSLTRGEKGNWKGWTKHRGRTGPRIRSPMTGLS
jgi:hypothetical protein